MANAFRTALVPLVRHDGDWLRCREAGCPAYWGAFRPTAWVAVKAQQHAAKAHGAHAPKAQAGRPQRRNVAALAGAPDLAALLAGHNRRLGNGIARTGYEFGPDHVLKVANHGDEKHNLAEMRSYAKAPAWARPLLCPAVEVASDGRWIVMRKCTRIGEASQREIERLQSALQHKVRDLHPGNVGWLDGHWVVTDYAQGFAGAEVAW